MPTEPDTTAQQLADGLSGSESGQQGQVAPAPRTARGWLGWPGRLLGRHWPAAVLFAAGAAMRVISLMAYHPALLYVDSLKYLYGTWPGSDPEGYRVLLKAVLAVGDLGTVAVVQHLTGLAVAVAIYVLLMRRGVNRWLGALAIAPVLLDGYQLQAEQTIMPDVAFEAIVAAGLIVLLWRPAVSWRRAVTVGVIFGLSATVHQVGLILIVPLAAYLLLLRGPLFSRGGWREPLTKAVALGAAFAVPVLAYSAYNLNAHGHFRLSNNGHAVGRLAMAADCATLRVPAEVKLLCPAASQEKNSPDWYEHSPYSPLRKIQVPRGRKVKLISALNHAVERQQPLRVIGAVARDSIRLFEVDRTSSLAITPINRWQFEPYYPSYLPEILAEPNGDLVVGLQYRIGRPFHYVLLKPAWGGKWQFDRTLAPFLHDYQVDGGYTPGPLLLIFTLAGLLASLYALFGTRRASPRARQLALCSMVYFVSAVGVLLVSDFFVFSWRYQLQAVTTLPLAGVFAATAAIEAVRHRRSQASAG